MSIPRDAVVDYSEILDRHGAPVGPIHPGEVLREEFLEPLGISARSPGRSACRATA